MLPHHLLVNLSAPRLARGPTSLTARPWNPLVSIGLINICSPTSEPLENIFPETRCPLPVSPTSKTEQILLPTSNKTERIDLYQQKIGICLILFFKFVGCKQKHNLNFLINFISTTINHYPFFFFFFTSKNDSFCSGSATRIRFWDSRKALISGKFWMCLYHLKRLLYWVFCSSVI